MNIPRYSHTEWSKSDKKRQIPYDITYMCNLKKMMHMNLFTKQNKTHKLREWTNGY